MVEQCLWAPSLVGSYQVYDMQQELDKFNKRGWRVVSVTSSQTTTYLSYLFVLEREKK